MAHLEKLRRLLSWDCAFPIVGAAYSLCLAIFVFGQDANKGMLAGIGFLAYLTVLALELMNATSLVRMVVVMITFASIYLLFKMIIDRQFCVFCLIHTIFATVYFGYMVWNWAGRDYRKNWKAAFVFCLVPLSFWGLAVFGILNQPLVNKIRTQFTGQTIVFTEPCNGCGNGKSTTPQVTTSQGGSTK